MKLGIDVGGTKTKVAVLDDKNHLMETKAYSTVIEEQPFLKFLTDLIREKIAQWPEISQIGIGIPGTVDTDAGMVVWCPALQVENFELCRILQKRIPLPVYADNDVNAWALAKLPDGNRLCAGHRWNRYRRGDCTQWVALPGQPFRRWRNWLYGRRKRSGISLPQPAGVRRI